MHPAGLESAYNRSVSFDINAVDATSDEQRLSAEGQLHGVWPTKDTLHGDEATSLRYGSLPVVREQFVDVAPQPLALLRADGLADQWVFAKEIYESHVHQLVGAA